MTLKITIVGAGIAGLSTALACRRAGHEVQIYERSALNNEIGAAIHIPPNASRGLLAWGLDPARARLVTCKRSYRAYGTTLERFHEGCEDYIEPTFGAPWYLSHRVDYHQELKLLATSPEGLGKPAKIHLKSPVAKYDPEGGSITLADGTTVTADLVIAADGVHTEAVEAILGHANPALPTTQYNLAYRLLIPASEIAADPETVQFTEEDDGRMKFLVSPMKRIVWYPCRDNEIHNITCIFSGDLPGTKEDWQKPVDKSVMLESYSNFHPAILAVLRKATHVTQWPLLFRYPVPTWQKGKLILVGDAAHPMLPHQGQGGAQAIEDAVAMGICLANLKDRSELPSRLRVFEDIRKNRASVMQIFSNAGQDEPDKIRKEAAKFIPENTVPQNPEEFFKYNFGYDIIRDTKQQMQKAHPGWELPDDYFVKKPVDGVYP